MMTRCARISSPSFNSRCVTWGALDVIPQLVSICHNPLFDRSLVVLVRSDKIELKNLGELVIVQDGWFGEHRGWGIAGALPLQDPSYLEWWKNRISRRSIVRACIFFLFRSFRRYHFVHRDPRVIEEK